MSIRRSMRFLLAAATLMAGVSFAEAQAIAYADRGNTNLRAGPGTHYLRIGSVWGGTQVYVHYCEYGWCVVTVTGLQGWMVQSRLAFVSARAPVLVPEPYYVPRYEPHFGFGFGFEYGDRRRRDDDRRRRDHDDDWSSEDFNEGPGGESESQRRQRLLQRDLDR